MEDEEGHKYLASYMIDAWRARGGHAAVPAKVRRESFCDSPEIIFTHGERQFSFFFGKTPFNDPQADTLISDKWLLFQTLGDQIPLPYTEFVAKDDPRDDAALVQAILQKAEDPHSPLAFPLVVKPSEGSLSPVTSLSRMKRRSLRARSGPTEMIPIMVRVSCSSAIWATRRDYSGRSGGYASTVER